MKRITTYALLLFSGYLFSMSCTKVEPAAPADDTILDGPVDGLTSAQKAMFLRGDAAFNNEIFTAETGLGPLFVATSCGSCHAGDGKGHPFTTLTRFGQSDSTDNSYMSMGAPQLQNRCLPGFTPETIPAGASFSRFMPPGKHRHGLSGGSNRGRHTCHGRPRRCRWRWYKRCAKPDKDEKLPHTS